MNIAMNQFKWGGSLSAAVIAQLNWWAGNGGVRAVDTAVAFQRFQNCLARLAFIKPLAGIRRHFFGFAVPTLWASQCAFKHYSLVRHCLTSA